MEQIQEEINSFLEEEPKKSGSFGGSNPFMALLGYYEEKPEEKKSPKSKTLPPIRPDDWIEKNHIRVIAMENAQATNFSLFETYKKAHGMPVYT